MKELLNCGIDKLGLSLSGSQLDKLIELQVQLLKWNSAFNLTAITNQDEVLKLHLLDSLAVVPYWHFYKTLDVGTGAGFPGLPLAIALPDQQFHLLDSNSKKIRFIRQQIHHLGLSNVEVFHCRVEEHQVRDYDVIVSRAFSSIVSMLELTEPLLAMSGRWMAMKGVYSQEEIQQIPAKFEEIQMNFLNIPGLNAERCLIELARCMPAAFESVGISKTNKALD